MNAVNIISLKSFLLNLADTIDGNIEKVNSVRLRRPQLGTLPWHRNPTRWGHCWKSSLSSQKSNAVQRPVSVFSIKLTMPNWWIRRPVFSRLIRRKFNSITRGECVMQLSYMNLWFCEPISRMRLLRSQYVHWFLNVMEFTSTALLNPMDYWHGWILRSPF